MKYSLIVVGVKMMSVLKWILTPLAHILPYIHGAILHERLSTENSNLFYIT